MSGLVHSQLRTSTFHLMPLSNEPQGIPSYTFLSWDAPVHLHSSLMILSWQNVLSWSLVSPSMSLSSLCSPSPNERRPFLALCTIWTTGARVVSSLPFQEKYVSCQPKLLCYSTLMWSLILHVVLCFVVCFRPFVQLVLEFCYLSRL